MKLREVRPEHQPTAHQSAVELPEVEWEHQEWVKAIQNPAAAIQDAASFQYWRRSQPQWW